MDKKRLLELAGIVLTEDSPGLNHAVGVLASVIAQQAKSEAERDWPTLDDEERREFGSLEGFHRQVVNEWLEGGDYMEHVDDLIAAKVREIVEYK